MSTATHVPEGFKLPSVLKLDYATIAIPDDLTSIDSLKELSTVIAETNHLLSLLSDEDKRNPTYEDDAGWVFTTDNQAAIKYAAQHYFLCEPSCVIDAIFNYCGEDVCQTCIDQLVDESLEKDFSVEVLTNGVYVVFKGDN
jgi:hypothetical protein